MAQIKINPFENLRKNAHVWRGENTLIWYTEGAVGGSFTVLILYDFGNEKRRLFLEVGGSQKIEFKNEELPFDQFEHLRKEVETIERLLINPTKSAEKDHQPPM